MKHAFFFFTSEQMKQNNKYFKCTQYLSIVHIRQAVAWPSVKEATSLNLVGLTEMTTSKPCYHKKIVWPGVGEEFAN